MGNCATAAKRTDARVESTQQTLPNMAGEIAGMTNDKLQNQSAYQIQNKIDPEVLEEISRRGSREHNPDLANQVLFSFQNSTITIALRS